MTARRKKNTKISAVSEAQEPAALQASVTELETVLESCAASARAWNRTTSRASRWTPAAWRTTQSPRP